METTSEQEDLYYMITNTTKGNIQNRNLKFRWNDWIILGDGIFQFVTYCFYALIRFSGSVDNIERNFYSI